MIRQALAYSLLSSYFSMAIQFVSVMIIARILSPAQMGTFGVAASIMVFAQIVRDLGVSQYISQEKELSEDRLRAAFALTLLAGWSIALFVYLSASYIAEFYGTLQMERIVKVLAFNFVVMPFGVLSLAVLRRKLMYKQRMFVEGCAATLTAITGVTFALLGHGAISLAYASVANACATVLASLFVRPQGLPWLPGVNSLGYVLAASWKMAGTTFMNFVSSHSPLLVFGRTAGLQEAGLYDRAAATVGILDKLLTSAASSVLLPYFSAEHRSGEELKEIYLHGVSLFTVCAWPFLTVTAYYAETIVTILYGDQWSTAATLVTILCLVQLIHYCVPFVDQLVTSIGGAATILKLNAVLTALQLFLLITLSSLVGITAALYGLAGVQVLRLILVLPILQGEFSISARDIVASTAKSGAISLVVLFAGVGVALFLKEIHIPAILQWTCVIITMSIAWVVSVAMLRHPISVEIRHTLIHNKNK